MIFLASFVQFIILGDKTILGLKGKPVDHAKLQVFKHLPFTLMTDSRKHIIFGHLRTTVENQKRLILPSSLVMTWHCLGCVFPTNAQVFYTQTKFLIDKCVYVFHFLLVQENGPPQVATKTEELPHFWGLRGVRFLGPL